MLMHTQLIWTHNTIGNFKLENVIMDLLLKLLCIAFWDMNHIKK